GSPRAHAKAPAACRAAPLQAAVKPAPRGGSQPQAAHGRSAARSDPGAQKDARARTQAGAQSRAPARPHPPALHAATAYSPQTAQAAPQTPAHLPPAALHRHAPDRAAVLRATTRLRQCDAAPAAEPARSPQAQTNARAAAPRAQGQTRPAPQPTTLLQAPLR